MIINIIIILIVVIIIYIIVDIKKKSVIENETKVFDFFDNINKDDYFLNFEKDELKVKTTNKIYSKLNEYIEKNEDSLLYNLKYLDVNMPLIISYDNQTFKNNKNESFINFMKGIFYYKYNFIICGINKKWTGWHGRYLTYLELINEIPENQLIFVTDSRDVLVNDSPIEFVKNYDKLTKMYNDNNKNKIIFGTEVGCCVNQMWHYPPGSVFKDIDDKVEMTRKLITKDIINRTNNTMNKKEMQVLDYLDEIEKEEYVASYNNHETYSLKRNNKVFVVGNQFPWEPWIRWNNIFKEKFIEANIKYKLGFNELKYPIIKLNFGMMVGVNKNIIKLLKTMNLQNGEDDQHIATEFFYMRPEMIILDYTQILLSNTGYKHFYRKCSSKTMNNPSYNINFNDNLEDHEQYKEMNFLTKNNLPENGIMYGFDIQNLKYFFIYDKLINFPCFIQSPGKDWNCYNELLYRLPYCDEKMCSYYYNLEETQKYNIRDIIIHEFKNKNGNIKINWILENILNPLFWALTMFMTKDLYNIIDNNHNDINIIIDSDNLLSYYRFMDLKNYISPWDDSFTIGLYSKKNIDNNILKDILQNIVKNGYNITIYYKSKFKKYSSQLNEHNMIVVNNNNISLINNLCNNYEIVLFNILLSDNKYREILKVFNMNIEYEEKYLNGTLKTPSIEIYIYNYNSTSNSYDYNKLLGFNNIISINDNYINPYKVIKFNKINVKIPNNIKLYLTDIYFNKKNNFNKNDDLSKNKQDENFYNIKVRRFTISEEKNKKITDFNNNKFNITDKDIILITTIYNNFINKYYDILESNENIKKIIYY